MSMSVEYGAIGPCLHLDEVETSAAVERLRRQAGTIVGAESPDRHEAGKGSHLSVRVDPRCAALRSFFCWSLGRNG